MEITLQGERLLLDYRRALAWPGRSALLVADTHFGKSAVFRREGVALPEGSDDEDLATLSDLVDEHRSQTLYILGDFLHAPLPRSHRFYRRFREWQRQQGVDVHVVLGNHDAHVDRNGFEDIHWHQQLALPPFVLVHEPAPVPGGYFLAGHIHPVTRVSTRSDSLRMPVFWQRCSGMVLPSFGALTGGHRIQPTPSERIYGVGPGVVVPLPNGQGGFR